jgi:hypothetical protein
VLDDDGETNMVDFFVIVVVVRVVRVVRDCVGMETTRGMLDMCVSAGERKITFLVPSLLLLWLIHFASTGVLSLYIKMMMMIILL